MCSYWCVVAVLLLMCRRCDVFILMCCYCRDTPNLRNPLFQLKDFAGIRKILCDILFFLARSGEIGRKNHLGVSSCSMTLCCCFWWCAHDSVICWTYVLMNVFHDVLIPSLVVRHLFFLFVVSCSLFVFRGGVCRQPSWTDLGVWRFERWWRWRRDVLSKVCFVVSTYSFSSVSFSTAWGSIVRLFCIVVYCTKWLSKSWCMFFRNRPKQRPKLLATLVVRLSFSLFCVCSFLCSVHCFYEARRNWLRSVLAQSS